MTPTTELLLLLATGKQPDPFVVRMDFAAIEYRMMGYVSPQPASEHRIETDCSFRGQRIVLCSPARLNKDHGLERNRFQKFWETLGTGRGCL